MNIFNMGFSNRSRNELEKEMLDSLTKPDSEIKSCNLIKMSLSG